MLPALDTLTVNYCGKCKCRHCVIIRLSCALYIYTRGGRWGEFSTTQAREVLSCVRTTLRLYERVESLFKVPPSSVSWFWLKPVVRLKYFARNRRNPLSRRLFVLPRGLVCDSDLGLYLTCRLDTHLVEARWLVRAIGRSVWEFRVNPEVSSHPSPTVCLFRQ